MSTTNDGDKLIKFCQQFSVVYNLLIYKYILNYFVVLLIKGSNVQFVNPRHSLYLYTWFNQGII